MFSPVGLVLLVSIALLNLPWLHWKNMTGIMFILAIVFSVCLIIMEKIILVKFIKHVRKCYKSRNYFMISYSSAMKNLESLADSRRLFPAVRNLRRTKAYRLVLYALENRSSVIYPCFSSGHGYFTHNLDYTDLVCSILNSIGVSYILSNDSPRGGKCGNYIQLYVCE